MRDGNLKNLANGKEIFAVLYRTEKDDYLWRQSVISEWIFQKMSVLFDFQPKFSGVFG